MHTEASAHLSLSKQRARWGDAVDPGLVIVPGVLLKYQQRLGLEALDVMVILNLVELWEEGDDMPAPRVTVLAGRVGRNRRTVERVLAKLEIAGLVRWLPSETRGGRTVRMFDLAGLRDKLASLSRQEVKAKPRRRAAA